MMVAAAPDDPDEFGLPSWNPEGEDLAFLRDEGLEMLALFKSIRDRKKRALLVDLARALAGDQPER